MGPNGIGGGVLTTVLLFSCLIHLPVVRGTTQDHYYNLINYLFNDYKPEVRPTLDDSFTTVFLNFWLLSIQNLDEKNQVLSTAVILETNWQDPWLTWDTSAYGNISSFRYPQKKLWLPDIVVINSVESQHQLGYDENPMVVQDNGNIVWYPSEVVMTSCDIDVTYYPFDTQICDIIVSTWVSLSTEIDLDLEPNATDIVMTRYSPSGTWELTDTRLQSIANEGGFTRLLYQFKLRRLSTFYVMNMILPVLFLSLTASCVFYLPSEAGEKIGMSMTVLLSYAVYLTIISDNMPQTSLQKPASCVFYLPSEAGEKIGMSMTVLLSYSVYLTIISDNMPQTSLQLSILSVYLTMLLGVTAITVLLSVLILHWHHTPEEVKVGRRTAASIRKIRTIFRMKPKPSSDENETPHSGIDLLGKRRDTSTTLRSKGGKISPAGISSGKIKVKVAEVTNQQEEEQEKITWPIVADTVDNVFFASTSLFIILLTIIVMLILVIGGDLQNKKDF